MVRVYATVTALLGAMYVVYHLLWLGRPEPPVPTPGWLAIFQLAWAFISFGTISTFQKRGYSPALPAIYVIYTGITYAYVLYLGTTRGEVLDAMVPWWWRVGAIIAGAFYVVEGARIVFRSRADRQGSNDRA